MSQTHDGSDRAYSTPRWVKVIGIVSLIVILLIGIMLLAGGEHSPNLHIPSTEQSAQRP